MKKVKILYHEAYFDAFEGAQKSLYLLLKNMNKNNFEIIFLTDEKNVLFEKFNEIENIKVEIFSTPKILKLFHKKLLKSNIFKQILIFIIFIIPHNIKFLFYLKRNKVNIVHFNTIRSILIKGWAPFILRIPIILHIRGDYDFPKIIKNISKKLATKIIFCSDKIIDIYKPINVDKYVIIYNGIDCNEVKQEYNKAKFKLNNYEIKNKFIIGTIGTLVPYKGHDILIKSIKELENKIENLLCLIVGKQPDIEWLEYLKSLIKELNLEDKVILTGPIYPSYLIMEKFDIFILPSLNEGLPRVILEAMCLKKPIIASNVGGVSDMIINNHNGYLFNSKDHKQLSDLIYKLYSNKTLRELFGNNSFLIVKNKFNIDRMIEKTENLYYSILERRFRQ